METIFKYFEIHESTKISRKSKQYLIYATSYLYDSWDQDELFETRETLVEAIDKFLGCITPENEQSWLKLKALTFWNRAKCVNTYQPDDKRSATEKEKFGRKLVRVRRYKDYLTGEIRRTVELIPDA